MAAPVCYGSSPPILNPHSTAEFSPHGTDLAGDVSTTLVSAGADPVLRTPYPAECGESLPITAGPFSEFKQQPQAAKVSTDLIFETWATELNNDLDMEFILDGVKNGFQKKKIGGAYGKQTGCMSTGPWITHLYGPSISITRRHLQLS